MPVTPPLPPPLPPPDDLLADLDDAQREAVLATSGPVCILAGAGTGKTRVISRRVAYALATGVTAASHVLVVTYTDKAAGQMRERLATLGRPGVTAATFHAAALRQLRHFWPRVAGRDLPDILASKVTVLAELGRTLPGGYRYVAARDLAAEIEWAKARRIVPVDYERAIETDGHDGPLPAHLFAPLYRQYELRKERAGGIDFEDMLEMTIRLIEDDPNAAAEIRDRYRWFSVDEYQDTNALQQALLEAWLGGRQDLAVVGDEDQTIYTFTGASAAWLTGFAVRHPAARVVRLETNYRSSPQVLAIANRLLASAPRTMAGPPKRLRATRPDGPPPTIRQFATGTDEEAAIAAEARRLISEDTPAASIAILVRTNGQLVGFESAFRAAAVPFQLRGERFFGRPEVRRAIAAVRSTRRATTVEPLTSRVTATWARTLDFQADEVPAAEEARQRHAALLALLEVARELQARDPAADLDTFLAEVARRADVEAEGAGGSGVELLTYHRAKGLEWDAVFLPALEEGILPIRQATDSAEIEEERRLLYVGVTRARHHLWLSFARRRDGRATERRRSRFLLEVAPPVARAATPTLHPASRVGAARALANSVETGGSDGSAAVLAAGSMAGLAAGKAALAAGEPLFDALRAWRLELARAHRLPPYVIFHDATLHAIADRRPSSLANLAEIPGVGPTRLERHGSDLVELVGQTQDHRAV